jgi:hypothetical protein
VADKLTQQIVEALSKAAAEPAGLPLFTAKSDPGLFTNSAKAAAQKCLSDRLLKVVRSESKGKSPRDLYALAEAGWEFLLAAMNPKQVLEDFVRVVEERQGEVGELLATARQMAETLLGLKDAVSRVLPRVLMNRIEPVFAEPRFMETRSNGAAALLEARPCTLTEAILEALGEWSSSANAGADCPLPELYRRVGGAATLGEFHDRLRELHGGGSIYLHPWTGPLHELPDPACALLVGHGIAFYASRRIQEPAFRTSDS